MEWLDLTKRAIDLAQTTIEKYGPEAWNVTLWVVRLNAIEKLIPLVLVSMALLLFGRHIFNWTLKWSRDNAGKTDDLSYFTVGFVALVGAVLA